MDLPIQAPPVVRDPLRSARIRARSTEGVLPSNVNCTGKVGCDCINGNITDCVWCCSAGQECGPRSPLCAIP